MMRSFFLIIFLVIISACTAEEKGEKKMSFENDPMRPHCIGRNFFQLPSSFRPSSVTTGMFKPLFAGSQDPSIDVTVRMTGVSRSQFLLEIAKRRAELKDSQSETMNIFNLEKKLSEEAVLFRVQEVEDAYFSELNLLVGTNLVTVRYESYRGQFLRAEEDLIRFSQQMTDNPDGKLRGFCLGPIVVNGDFKLEKARYLFRNGSGADIEVGIDTYTPDERKPLLVRMSGPNSLLSIFNVNHSVLRAGERYVMGMRAQEWLGWAKVTDEQDVKALQFNLETMRPTPGKNSPRLTITFETAQPLEDGRPTKTMIPDDEAVRLWDSVVGSIRLQET